jgi:hypothetical protein
VFRGELRWSGRFGGLRCQRGGLPTDGSELMLDINGYFASPATGGLSVYPATPCRIAGTREAVGTLGGPLMDGNGTRLLPVPASTLQYTGNSTSLRPERDCRSPRRLGLPDTLAGRERATIRLDAELACGANSGECGVPRVIFHGRFRHRPAGVGAGLGAGANTHVRVRWRSTNR